MTRLECEIRSPRSSEIRGIRFRSLNFPFSLRIRRDKPVLAYTNILLTSPEKVRKTTK